MREDSEVVAIDGEEDSLSNADPSLSDSSADSVTSPEDIVSSLDFDRCCAALPFRRSEVVCVGYARRSATVFSGCSVQYATRDSLRSVRLWD